MAVTVNFASGTQAATLDVEHTLGTDPDTTDGVFQLFVDVNDMARADRTVLRVYEKVLSAGTQRLVATWVLTNEQIDKIFASPSLILGNGFKFTLEQTDGTGRSYPWRISQVS